MKKYLTVFFSLAVALAFVLPASSFAAKQKIMCDSL
jgi:hypothetical protein